MPVSFRWFVCAVLPAVLLLGACGRSAEMQVTLAAVQGTVEVSRAGAGFAAVPAGTVLEKTDIVRTVGAASGCELRLSTGSVVRLDGETTVGVTALAGRDGGARETVELARGTMRAKVRTLGSRDEFSVRTKTAVAGVRGTEFSVAYTEAAGTAVRVATGRVAVVPAYTLPAAAGDGRELAKALATKLETSVAAGEKLSVSRADAEAVQRRVDAVIAAAKPAKTDKAGDGVSAKARQDALSAAIDREFATHQPLRAEPDTKKEDGQAPDAKAGQGKPASKAERARQMIAEKPKSLDEIKEVFERIDEITLYSGRVVRGAILQRGKTYTVLTVNGVVSIPEADIKQSTVIR